MDALKRYYSIVDDPEAFAAAARRPQPLFVWTNTLRTTCRRMEEVFSRDGYDLTPLGWHSQAFRVTAQDENESPGRHWAYPAGWFHIQEASSMIPALLLNPQPGERVLDLCAAPGNKTALMAQALGNRGTVVANDIFWDRIGPLRAVIERLGLLNVSATCHDGTSYPRVAGQFDRVLVDVPCSCEGTTRRFPGLLERPPTRRLPKRFQKQKLLLQSAIRRCRTGGRILYSTCTYAPEENEAVVDAVLAETDGAVRILPVSLPGLRTAPGLTSWAGESFHDDLRHTIRIWPHLNDTGGFYIALLQKVGGDAREEVHASEVGSPCYRTAPGSTQHVFDGAGRMSQILCERFAIGRSVFNGLQLLKTKRQDVYGVAADHRPPQMAACISGLPLFHMRFRYPKPTTACAAAFGTRAGRNVIDVTAGQLKNYLRRKPFALEKKQAGGCDSTGYVLIRYKGAVLGVGFYDDGNDVVASLLPKNMALK